MKELKNPTESTTKEKVDIQASNPYGFTIVGVGASAGGLQALKTFFDHMPVDKSCSFVVVQHLSPNHKSLMKDLLAKNTELPITEVSEDTLIKPNNIYLIPPKKNIELIQNTLRLSDKPETKELNLPIDIFFNSLALARKEFAVGILLSGTGSDGTIGIKNIHSFNGLVMVQSPEDTEFAGMVNSAIDTGLVDYIMPANKLPNILADFIDDPQVKYGVEHEVYKDKSRFDKILNHIKNVTDFEFKTFKKPTLVRRIARRMGLSKHKTFKDYYDFLLENPSESEELASDFLINVTDFFRDKSLWEELEKNIIPDLVSKTENGENLKFWVVAGSTGEEAYSYAIMMYEEMKKQDKLGIKLKIFATDINRDNIEYASSGVYTERQMASVPQHIKFTYFENHDVGFKIREDIRSMLIFSQHDILNDPPFTKMDLISCRNLLIYLEKPSQEKILGILQYALKLRSVLILGKSEALGENKDYFLEVDGHNRIYKNLILTKSLFQSNINIESRSRNNTFRNQFYPKTRGRNEDFSELLGHTLSEELQLAIVYTNSNLQILEAVGDLRNYLTIPQSGFSSSLMNLMPEKIKPKLNLGIIKAEKEKINVKLEGLEIREDDNKLLDLLIIPSKKQDDLEVLGAYVFVFIPKVLDPKDALLISNSDKSDKNASTEMLEFELAEARNDLISLQQEIELRNEELQTTNEELLATNEELQSTNEELQSVNEELHTVNAELNLKVTDLADANATIDNILKSTDISTLVLDRDLQIKSFTIGIKNLFNITLNDIGRKLSNFSHNFGKNGDEFYDRVQTVIKSGNAHKKEIKDLKGNWYLKRITPFLQDNQTIDGAVITYVDINEQKKTQLELKKREQEFHELFDNAPDMFAALSAEGKIVNCNKELVAKLEYDNAKDLIGKSIREVAPGFTEEELQHDMGLLLKGKHLTDLERTVVTKSGKKIPLRVNAKPFMNQDGSLNYVVGSWRDISRVREVENELKDQNLAFEQVLESAMAGYWDWQIQEGTEYLSPSFKQMFGYEDHEMENRPESWQKIMHPDDLPGVLKVYDAHVNSKGEVPYDNEVRYFHKDGSIVWVWCKGKVIEWGENDEPIRMVGSHVNITHLKKLTQSNKELERFAYVASHDLQEPLRTISDFVGLFKKEYSKKLDENGNTYLGFIDEAAERMRELVKGILSYSRIGIDSNLEKVDLNKVLDGVVKDLQAKIEERKAKVHYVNLPTVEGSSAELHSLFLNLLGNALKFVSDNRSPIIKLSHQELENGFQISVHDNGIGIDQAQTEKIFDLFTRLHNMDDYEGTGIGLAHSKKIIEMHQGRIWCESELGKGSTFHFTLNTH